jgi:gamma-glutamylaminecyclotransferase
MGKHLIFIYGTLKRGFVRHHALREQRYIGIARTEPKYGMFGYGGYPALVDETLAEASNVTAKNRIFGELYEVDDACMQELDKIEGTDRGLFERRDIALGEITMTTLPSDEAVWGGLTRKVAQAYFFKKKLAGAGDCGPLWVQK